MKALRFHDPVTGDALTRLEYFTLHAQLILRSPWFIVGFNLATVGAFVVGLSAPWNYFASWLAIMVEWVVGTFMFGQTKRDALVTRETREAVGELRVALTGVRALLLRLETLEQTAIRKEDQLLQAGDPDHSPPLIKDAAHGGHSSH